MRLSTNPPIFDSCYGKTLEPKTNNRNLTETCDILGGFTTGYSLSAPHGENNLKAFTNGESVMKYMKTNSSPRRGNKFEV
jgi:hypothetical protein